MGSPAQPHGEGQGRRAWGVQGDTQTCPCLSPAPIPSTGPQHLRTEPGLRLASALPFWPTGAPSSGRDDNISQSRLFSALGSVPEGCFCHAFPEHSRNCPLFSSPTVLLLVSTPIVPHSRFLTGLPASAFRKKPVGFLNSSLDFWCCIILLWGMSVRCMTFSHISALYPLDACRPAFAVTTKNALRH